MSPQDFTELRAKGLCFRCKKPYSPGHECPLKQLRVMLAEEDEELDLQQVECDESAPPEQGEEQEGAAEEEGALPVYSMAGISSPRTMRLQGVMEGRKVTVLVDSGASHNFISASLVAALQLHTDNTGRFGIQLGDGRRRESEGVCRGVSLLLSACEVLTDYLVFSLGGVDIILGVAWLAELGEVSTNWETLTMSFTWKGNKVVLRGDPSLCRSAVGLRALWQTREAEFWAVVVETEPTKLSTPDAGRLREVLEAYGEVFGEPHGLPPRRLTDHSIVLNPGTKSVSVRPYRYGYIQKDEIEVG